MKIKILTQISGMRNGATYPRAGEVMELKPGDNAFDLLTNGYAEIVEEPVIETAEATPPEIAARIIKPKPRGSARSFSPRER